MNQSQTSPQADIAGVLQSLVQQQTAIFQQQAALLQVHGESVRLQRLLIEHLLGGGRVDGVVATALPVVAPAEWMQVDSGVRTPPAVPAQSPPPPQSPSVAPPLATAPITPSAAAAEPLSAPPEPPVPGAGAARAALYYQSRPPRTPGALASAQPQDLELLRRLHEMGDASRLILQFGPHKGETLAQTVMSDPDYVRQLVTRAQRPEVRAAAGRLVEALEAAAAHKTRPARGGSRRSRTSS